MNNITPLYLYQKMLEKGNYKYDFSQEIVLRKMNDIHRQFVIRQYKTANRKIKKIDKFIDCLFRKSHRDTIPQVIKGLYIWGVTGNGKTLLMDLFYRSLPGMRKLRLHFHRFMVYLHKEVFYLQGYKNPLEIIADKFKTDIDILCFDEFFVSDIVDAILLGTLVEAFFLRGITLVITSNIAPDQLYLHGFQRSRFLPVINLIKNHCDVVHVDSVCDYRMSKVNDKGNLWFVPIGDSSDQQMMKIFVVLSGRSFFIKKERILLKINNRLLPIIAVVNGVLLLDFFELCKNNWCYNDYVILAQRFHSILLRNVQQMGSDQEDVARRFLSLVDELYERRVKLVITSSVSISEVYNGDMLHFEYQRCLSRLYEMQGEEYFNLPHNP
ncbi:cell division protein ZapE [Blochmannia endosymbiont of Camponotus (Colobopsis) obliquus]|uniref:cell division protein ZapE n=1 Tax=Blochmannia endosymbiont of Camponotus (Colobopsis) obliquus TaxID=1505597 RepID=UPI00061A8561|nr:cell division protein ZapE [Blochmannia endosymbiont of Camponotus (Colobopsis) obliquus]AKC60231.1 Uncharacterized protein YhcM [Blochmannia endosymbiont of Camponotus (Colobopsis) obliquus]